MDRNLVLELCMDVRYNRTSVEGASVTDRKQELVTVFAELMKNYEKNVIEINEIIKENVNEVLKVKVDGALDIFAEVARIAHGATKHFYVKNGKIVVEYIALGQEIRRQKIYGSKVTALPKALGGAVYAEYDDILAGRAEAFTEMVDAIVDAIMAEVMASIQSALKSAMANAPSANRYAGVFDLQELRSVCNTVSAYGKPTIIGTAIALSNIMSDTNFKASMSENMKDQFNKEGFIGTWEGRALVLLPNTFIDETNTDMVLDNSILYVLPVNADKPVKVTFEGDLMLREKQEKDWSVTKEVAQKVGVNILQVHNLGIFEIQ